VRPALPSFEGWIESVFDHPVHEPEWWWEEGAVLPLDPAQNPAEALGLLTELLENSSALAPYTDAQVAQGLWYLFDTSCSAYTTLLRHPDVPRSARERFATGLLSLYRDLFAVRCAPVVGHPSAEGLNMTCYMLLDLSEALGPNPHDGATDELLLAAMEEVLRIRHVACQDSALHGLGHWAAAYPEQVASIIDGYPRATPSIPDELRQYALSAKSGQVE
jgi:hypothetical protein